MIFQPIQRLPKKFMTGEAQFFLSLPFHVSSLPNVALIPLCTREDSWLAVAPTKFGIVSQFNIDEAENHCHSMERLMTKICLKSAWLRGNSVQTFRFLLALPYLGDFVIVVPRTLAMNHHKAYHMHELPLFQAISPRSESSGNKCHNCHK